MTPTDLANVAAFLQRTAEAAPAGDAGRACIEQVLPLLNRHLRRMVEGPRDDGGCAFPILGVWQNQATGETTTHQTSDPGMSLRDHFAGEAMAGMIATAGAPCLAGLDGYEDQTAKAAYRMADAMLKARAS